ncbi:hypothetical protein FRB95_000402 [Tulasnella sp. JGI-2019a]|nr:hypothetical protein FRB95_000402 [Tulasnella sp. JGI-2019a]
MDVFTQPEPSSASHLDSDHDMQPQDGSPRPSRSHLPNTHLGSARDGALNVNLDPVPLPHKEKRTFLVAADSPSFKAGANAKSRKTGKSTTKTTLSAEDYEKLAKERKLEHAAEKEADQDILREFGLPTTQVVKQSIWYIKPITSDEVDRYTSHLWNRKKKPSLTLSHGEDYRYNPSSKYLEKLKDCPLALCDFRVALASGLTWMWATVYNHQHPDDADAEMLLSAIGYHILMKNLPQLVGEDLEAKIYKRPNGLSVGTICLFCSKAAKDLLTAEFTIFAFHEKGIDHIFFLQGPKSWGQRIVLDITNGPTVLSELIEGINNSLKDIIKLNKDGEPSSLCITHLDWVNPLLAPGIAPHIIVDPKQVRTGNWRLSFTPNKEALKEWKVPTQLGGYPSHGSVVCSEPPFCISCCSFSHQKEHCNWWSILGVMVNPKQLKGLREITWVKVVSWKTQESVKPKKSGKTTRGAPHSVVRGLGRIILE